MLNMIARVIVVVLGVHIIAKFAFVALPIGAVAPHWTSDTKTSHSRPLRPTLW